jgi:hypothetical protein
VSKDKANFKALENFVKIQNVKFVGGQIHGAYGKGKVKLLFSFGKINTIVDVLYVLGLMKNLLSIGMIVDKGNIVIIDFNKCLVVNNQNPNSIVVRGVRDPKNGLHKLEVHSIESKEIMETHATKVALRTNCNSN